MRTWVIIISIFVVLSLLVFAESIVVNKFCTEMEQTLEVIDERILSDNLSENDLASLTKVWDNNKIFVFALSNHNSFAEFEKHINNLYYYSEVFNKEQLCYSMWCLKKANELIKVTSSCSFENIF